jgi:4-amino-4-deoxychorismate lyase
MFRFIESIQLRDGHLQNMEYHRQRVDRTRLNFFPQGDSIDLVSHLSKSGFPDKGLFKCRVIYDRRIVSVEFLPYSVRPVKSLKVVESNSIHYDFKFEQRGALSALWEKRGDCDDIIIIRNNRVTDASYANLVFKRDNEWITPSDYLLNGTMRQSLLDKKLIKEELILRSALPSFEKVKLINAMLGLDSPEIEISQIQG